MVAILLVVRKNENLIDLNIVNIAETIRIEILKRSYPPVRGARHIVGA